MAAQGIADIGQPHRVEAVQNPHRAGLVPPGRGERVEARDLAAIDEAVRPGVRGCPVHARSVQKMPAVPGRCPSAGR
jgi:hypothetical protein